MKTPDYYVEYSDFNEVFEVCRILERHPDGKMAKAELLARCPEEGDAYFICRNLNAIAGIENPQEFVEFAQSSTKVGELKKYAERIKVLEEGLEKLLIALNDPNVSILETKEAYEIAKKLLNPIK